MYRLRILLVIPIMVSVGESDKTGDPDEARSQNADVEEVVAEEDRRPIGREWVSQIAATNP